MWYRMRFEVSEILILITHERVKEQESPNIISGFHRGSEIKEGKKVSDFNFLYYMFQSRSCGSSN